MTDATPRINISPCFATPIAETQMADCEALNRELKAFFLECEKDEQYRKQIRTPTHQVNIFESEFDLFSWPQPRIRQLRDFCMRGLYLLIAQLNGYKLEELNNLEVFNHCWFHVTRYGGYINGHNHPMASWSGVYCVDPGETPAEHPDSGVLRFEDPNPAAAMFMDPANAHLQRPYGGGSVNFKLRPGQLILFPSWLMHQVMPFYGRDTRITVAFNAWTRERASAAGK